MLAVFGRFWLTSGGHKWPKLNCQTAISKHWPACLPTYLPACLPACLLSLCPIEVLKLKHSLGNFSLFKKAEDGGKLNVTTIRTTMGTMAQHITRLYDELKQAKTLVG